MNGQLLIKMNRKEKYLFLDRDGVLNERNPEGYILNPEELKILPGVPEAVARLNKYFARIIIISNQQGVAKGLMTHDDLHVVNKTLLKAIEEGGGSIDDVIYCTDSAGTPNNCRKPSLAMAREAQNRFPEIDLAHSWMVGDTGSDMQFAINGGMHGIMIGPENLRDDLEQFIEGRFDSLLDFARFFSKHM